MSAEATESDLSEDERRGLELVRETRGVHQSEFWKELDVSSRKGSRIASKLEERGFVEREETVHEGNTTYLITPVINERDLDFSLLMAGEMLSPFVGEEEVDAQSDAFSQWIMNLAYEDQIDTESKPEPEPEPELDPEHEPEPERDL
ncbi:probable transcription factor (homolog to RNA polymerase III subunit RPC34) [Halobacterium hubeiense]|uniref:Probable transcription factor (Homolog to RNA polymerase III subunit RPC34) n=1 Tax=Halobacterium hubeiense TaxID=1407499 RepID=A0A0U5CY34_9EURY|nr:probable transcription factor (homolog to RNA polymerase III subunit RPC34) [Halobacterium hubeiense]